MSKSEVLAGSGLGGVIGMHQVTFRLRETVVNPWTSKLRGDPAVVAPRRVLIYGAPGCGVSYIANLLTSELGSLGCDAVAAHDLDEVADSDTAELEELLRGGATQDVVIVGATRRPWTMPDAAFGPGGFERAVFVPPPDWDARRFRIWETLTRLGEPASLVEPLVIATEGWSGRDIETELARPLDWSDEAGLISALEHITPASRGWLESARLLTRFGAISRLADDLAAYLQRYRLL